MLLGFNYDYKYSGNTSRALRVSTDDTQGMTAVVDLDGDSEEELIEVSQTYKEGEQFGVYKVYINGIDYGSDDLEGYIIDRSSATRDWYIEDVDSSDKYCEILLCLEESTLLLRYDDGKLVVLGELEAVYSTNGCMLSIKGDGKIKVNNAEYCIEKGMIIAD